MKMILGAKKNFNPWGIVPFKPENRDPAYDENFPPLQASIAQAKIPESQKCKVFPTFIRPKGMTDHFGDIRQSLSIKL